MSEEDEHELDHLTTVQTSGEAEVMRLALQAEGIERRICVSPVLGSGPGLTGDAQGQGAGQLNGGIPPFEHPLGAVDPVLVRKLLRRGEWVDFAPQENLARQGIHLDRLLLISSGEAAVLLGGKIVARLAPGKFVGEISFLSGDLTTAMVVATQPTRCLTWNKERLERLLAREPDLLNVFYAAVGKDLAAKVAHHNVALSQV